MRRLALAAVLAAASPVDAESSFTVLPQVQGVTGQNTAEGISADGSTVTGNTFGPTQAFRWNATIGTVPLFPVMPFMSVGNDLSADGSVIVGTLTTSDFGQPPFMTEAFRWTEAGGLEHMGFVPGGSQSSANAISDDATFIVGASLDASGWQWFRWTAADGMVGLGRPPDTINGFGMGISGDGATIVGVGGYATNASQAFYWTEATGFVGIGTLIDPAPANAGASDASADGSVIVGSSTSPNGPSEAFRWTEENGMVGLGDLPGGVFQSFGYAVSGDGSIVVGESAAGGSGNDAFVWDAAHGMRFLIDVLEEQGVDMTGWRIRTARGISNDGTTITGFAVNPSSEIKSYAAVVPEPGRMAMLATGLAALAGLDRRRSRN